MSHTLRESSDAIELVEQQSRGVSHTKSLSSTFDRNRFKATDHLFQSTRHTTSNPAQSTIPDHAPSYTLLILQLLSHFKIKVFPADTHIAQYERTLLGEGSTFRVEATKLPVWSARAHFRYRDLKFPRQGEKFNFEDHTRTQWNRSTMGAWKVLTRDADPNKDRERLLRDLFTELRVLVHPPLQRHPHIVHVLGFVWLQDHQFFATEQQVAHHQAENLREWPTVVTLEAPHGSLRAFMKSESFCIILPSLSTKLRLCADILSGMRVSQNA